jgi:hypothetical protein
MRNTSFAPSTAVPVGAFIVRLAARAVYTKVLYRSRSGVIELALVALRAWGAKRRTMDYPVITTRYWLLVGATAKPKVVVVEFVNVTSHST